MKSHDVQIPYMVQPWRNLSRYPSESDLRWQRQHVGQRVSDFVLCCREIWRGKKKGHKFSNKMPSANLAFSLSLCFNLSLSHSLPNLPASSFSLPLSLTKLSCTFKFSLLFSFFSFPLWTHIHPSTGISTVKRFKQIKLSEIQNKFLGRYQSNINRSFVPSFAKTWSFTPAQ